MGGEWGVGASLTMESVSPKWRGIISGLLQEGYAMGNLLAAVVYSFDLSALGLARDVFYRGGAGAALAFHLRQSEGDRSMARVAH